MQGCDCVKELTVPCDETVSDFIKRAQRAGLVPSLGVGNIVLCDGSGDPFSSDLLISSCPLCECLWVRWDECGASPFDVKALADKGDAEAQFNYGLYLENGYGVSVDLASAARYYKLAADQGHAKARFNYGNCLRTGSGVSVDLSSAARYYKLAADQGLASAQFNYGLCLARGSGVPVDLLAAACYYKLAADQGVAQGQLCYGLCLDEGSGVPVDHVSAARYYKHAADQGFAMAQFNYGLCLARGYGVPVDLVSAARYLKFSADQGLVEGQRSYGMACYFGYGRHSDYFEAATWFRRAAEQGDPTASWCYGVCLYMGKGVDFNKEEARRMFEFAADNGDQVGQFCYGLLMFEENGCNLKPDSLGWTYLVASAASGCAEAAVIVGLQNFADTNTLEHDCFMLALEKRDFCALYNYGMWMFMTNWSSSEDLSQIVECFRVVAVQNGDGSEYSYDRFLQKGIGVDSDDRWRIVLLECEWGLPESEYLYGKYLYSRGQTNEALEYFKRSAEGKGKHAEAMFAYCAVLVKDFGYPVSDPKVKGYFERASKDGVLEAQYNYGMGLLSESTEIEDRRHGVEVLSWAAKEILLRRQCKSVKVQSREQQCTFFYSPLPNVLTKRATDNYIWDHFSENLARMERMSWYEILHPVTPTMRPQERSLLQTAGHR